MSILKIKVKVHVEDGGFYAIALDTEPDLVCTQADTMMELRSNIIEVLNLYYEDRISSPIDIANVDFILDNTAYEQVMALVG